MLKFALVTFFAAFAFVSISTSGDIDECAKRASVAECTAALAR